MSDEEEIYTFNKFKSSTIYGPFNNLDYEDGSNISNAYFQRNVLIDGNLNSNNILLKNIDTCGNFIYRSVATEYFVMEEIHKLLGDQPSSFYDSLSEISEYILSDINNETALTNAIATKQGLLTNTSIIPKLGISEYFPSNSIDNNILFLHNSNTNYGIKFLINSNTGSINPNVINNDSLIYATSPNVNGAALFLSTYSAEIRSISYIRINVNSVDIGSSSTANSVVRITSRYIVNTCPNVTFSSLPICEIIPSISTQLVNKSYVDTEISNLYLYVNRYALAENTYFKFQINNLIIDSVKPYIKKVDLENTYYSKNEIIAAYYTKTNINTMLDDLSSNLDIYYASKSFVANLYYNKSSIDNDLNLVKYKQSPIGGQPSIEIYPNIFIDSIDGNAMRIYNTSTNSKGIYFNPNGSESTYEINMNSEGHIILANAQISSNGRALITKDNSEILMNVRINALVIDLNNNFFDKNAINTRFSNLISDLNKNFYDKNYINNNIYNKTTTNAVIDGKINALKGGATHFTGLVQFTNLPIFSGSIDNNTVASNQFICKSIGDHLYTTTQQFAVAAIDIANLKQDMNLINGFATEINDNTTTNSQILTGIANELSRLNGLISNLSNQLQSSNIQIDRIKRKLEMN